jgi:hypothetical protein
VRPVVERRGAAAAARGERLGVDVDDDLVAVAPRPGIEPGREGALGDEPDSIGPALGDGHAVAGRVPRLARGVVELGR